jgi:hypothetical protein
MSTLRQALASAEAGVVARLPDGAALADTPGHLVLRDEARGVTWEAIRLPWRVDLDDEALLYEDVEAQCRWAFDDAFRPDEANPEPRTADASWTLVVELAVTPVAGGRALAVIRRLVYQRGDEIVVGGFVVPTAHGVVEIRAAARVAQTGFRESMVLVMSGVAGFLPQSAYDAPEHDATFPHHPLSLVRAALAWLRAPDGGGLAITAPASPLPRGPVVVAELGCTITPPARYLPLPFGVPMSGAACFTRHALFLGPTPRMLDLTRYTLRRRLFGRASLETLVRETIAGWENEGARDIELALSPDGEDDPAGLGCTVRFRVGENAYRSAQRWRRFPDGLVLRVAVSAPPWVALEALTRDAADAARSLSLC